MNSSFKVLVVDDESLAREAIILRLEEFCEFTVCGEADNGNDAIILNESLRPDVVFLDIEMPELNGIAAAKTIAKSSDTLIVFVSAYSHYALQAFRVNAIDYILKPIDDLMFKQMIEKLKGRLLNEHLKTDERLLSLLNELQADRLQKNAEYLKRMAVKLESDTIMLNTKDIESIVSAKDYLCIKVNEEVYIHRCTMKQIETLLDPSEFLRVHRSHIVNLNSVTRIENEKSGKSLVTQSGDKHPVSRRYYEKLKNFIERNIPN